jgi:hypothetical protein
MMHNMKNSLLNTLARLAVVGLILSFSLKLVAGPAASGDLLRRAYITLSLADHDYKGHRVAAMKHIEAAAKMVGVDVRGGGKGREKQGVSDAQLRAAQGLLEQARPGLPEKAQKHVDRALDQLSIALKIK